MISNIEEICSSWQLCVSYLKTIGSPRIVIDDSAEKRNASVGKKQR